ncbi:MAG: hypothetical protein AAGE01_12465, partial [Pseudomonadota bacterium]
MHEFLLVILLQAAAADQAPHIMRADAPSVQVELPDGRSIEWTLNAELDPDTLELDVGPDSTEEACFVSEIDRHCIAVGLGDSEDFVIVYNDVAHNQRVSGELPTPPAAVFDQAYQDAHRGTIKILIPEVYELVNVAIALTEFSQSGPYADSITYKDTPYYQDVLEYFSEHQDHPAIRRINDALYEDVFSYFRLKMNGYAFEFEGEDISQSPVYDRTGYHFHEINHLRPYVDDLQDFSSA